MRIAANLLEQGVGTRGGREGVSRTESSRPRGDRGVGGAGETAAASNSAARASRASRSERSLEYYGDTFR